MISGLVRSVPRPDCATRSDLAVAAFCLAFDVDPVDSRDGEQDPDDR